MSHEEIQQRSYFKKASAHLKKMAMVERTQYCSWCCEPFKSEDRELFCGPGCLRMWSFAKYENEDTAQE